MTSKCLMEIVLEVSRNDCQVVNALSDVDCSVDRLSIRENTTLHAVKPKGSCDVASMLISKSIKSRTTRSGEVWAESSSCSACAFFSKLSFIDVLGSESIGKDKLRLHIVVPSKSDLRLLRSRLRNSGLDYVILKTNPFAHKEMTVKERKALQMALDRHYFDCEDRTSLTELADSMGLSASSLSELIRRGTKKAITFYFERNSE